MGANMSEITPVHYVDVFGAVQLVRPCGITTDESMNIYVAQGPAGRVAKFDRDGKLLMTFGRGEGGWFKKVGKLGAATGVAVDTAGDIYVADARSNCIQRFDSQGHFLTRFGQRGTGDCEFNRCRSVQLDAEGCLWVVDARNNRIQKFGGAGNLLLKLGGNGGDKKRGGQAQFQNPSDLAFDEDGCVWVTDSGHGTVHKFDPEGRSLLTFGKSGSPDSSLMYPRGIALDSEERVYVVDTWANQILVFDKVGNYLFSFGGPKKLGGRLNAPYGITIDRQRRILVTDNANNRVMVFSAS